MRHGHAGGTTADEGSRHMISMKPPDAKVGQQVWHDLNQFNHVAVTDEMQASLFEEQRVRYCQYITEHEDKVEDAITGNMLLIKDQLIFLEIANSAPPERDTHIHATLVSID